VAGIAALGLVLVLGVPMPATAPGVDHLVGSRGPVQAAPGSLLAAVADGLRLLRDVPLLRSTTVATTLSQLWQGLLPVALPLLAVRLDHPASAGAWLLTALSAGGLAGSLASGRLLAWRTAPTVLIAALAACGAFLTALAAAPGFDSALGLAVLAGAADGPILAATLAVRQRTVPAGRYAQPCRPVLLNRPGTAGRLPPGNRSRLGRQAGQPPDDRHARRPVSPRTLQAGPP